MNKLIWIDEEKLNKEKFLIERLKPEIKQEFIWCFGDLNNKPICYKNGEIIINWSFEENKVEFFLKKNYVNWFSQYYFYLIYYGEWGQLNEKHITFIELESEKEKIKSKKPLKIKELIKFIKKNEKIKISIYFEVTIQNDPEKESYLKGNNFLISNLGGLYDVVDPLWVNWNKCEENYWYLSKEKKIKIENYLNSEKLHEISKETALTAKEMKINKRKWNLFKFN